MYLASNNNGAGFDGDAFAEIWIRRLEKARRKGAQLRVLLETNHSIIAKNKGRKRSFPPLSGLGFDAGRIFA